MNLTADIEWPVNLPLPFLEYSGANRNSTISTAFEMGPIERRSRFTKTYVPISVRWMLNEAQHNAFRSFFQTVLGNGSAAFPLELRYPKNSVLTGWLVRFTNGFSSSFMEGIWQVSAQLDLIDSLLLPEFAIIISGITFMVRVYPAFLTSDGLEFDVIQIDGYGQFMLGAPIEYVPMDTVQNLEMQVSE